MLQLYFPYSTRGAAAAAPYTFVLLSLLESLIRIYLIRIHLKSKAGGGTAVAAATVTLILSVTLSATGFVIVAVT